ncbi:MAG: DUF3137 domain-containing protein [Aureispira sp.]|nr:DUF3137 domain-containing protein [Aureispira sp.]
MLIIGALETLSIKDYTGILIASGILFFLVFLVVISETAKKYKQLKSEFRIEFKQKVFRVLLKYLAPNTEYWSDKVIDRGTLKNSKLVGTKYHKREGEDYFEGKMNGRAYEFCELKLFKSSSSNKDLAFFEGIFMKIEYPSPYKGPILLRLDSQKNSHRKTVGYKKLIECLEQMARKVIYPLNASLDGGYLYITISAPSTKNFFSVRLDQPLDEMLIWEETEQTLSVLDAGARVTDTQLEDLLEEVALYLDFVDKLTQIEA